MAGDVVEADRLMAEMGIGTDRARRAMKLMCDDIMERIDRNFRRMGISPYNDSRSSRRRTTYTATGYSGIVARRKGRWRLRSRGELLRSIHWVVFNRTGGDTARIRFYMQNIAQFVELSVQNGFRERDGGLPARIRGQGFGGIDVNRPSYKWSGTTLGRKAKPSITSEVRLHGRMLFDRLVRDYGYVGNMIMLSAMLPPGVTPCVEMRMFANWDVYNPRAFRFDDGT